MERAAEVRDEVIRLVAKHYLVVLSTAVIVRYRDGIVTLNGERFLGHISHCGGTFARFLATFALSVPPLTEAGVGALQTTVDLERARLIQSTLAAAGTHTVKAGAESRFSN